MSWSSIVGLAAYISLAEKGSTLHLPAGAEAVVETVSRGIDHGWARSSRILLAAFRSAVAPSRRRPSRSAAALDERLASAPALRSPALQAEWSVPALAG